MTQPMLELTTLVNISHFKGNGVIPVAHFADTSATFADNFAVETAMIGESFLDKLV